RLALPSSQPLAPYTPLFRSPHRWYSAEACPTSRMAVRGDRDRQDRPRRSPPAAGLVVESCSLVSVLAAFLMVRRRDSSALWWAEIGRAHVWTPFTFRSRMSS